MGRYLLRRLLLALVTFIGITLVTFAVVHLAPGDPASAADADGRMSVATYQQLRAQYHLDDPLATRYLRWAGDILRLDFGRSLKDGRLVTRKIAERLPATLALCGAALIIALAISIPLGAAAAARAGSWFDRLLGGACFGLYAVPQYVMAMVLILLVGVRWEWLPFLGLTSVDHAELPPAGRAADMLRHSVLIGICFIYPLVAQQVRFVRANVAVALDADYIRTARAKGAGRLRVLFRHALRNALLPLLTQIGLLAPVVLGGSVILEVMFSWPGMGRLTFEAIMARDYPVVMALSVLSAVVVLGVTLLVDLLYLAADPRVRCP